MARVDRSRTLLQANDLRAAEWHQLAKGSKPTAIRHSATGR